MNDNTKFLGKKVSKKERSYNPYTQQNQQHPLVLGRYLYDGHPIMKRCLQNVKTVDSNVLSLALYKFRSVVVIVLVVPGVGASGKAVQIAHRRVPDDGDGLAGDMRKKSYPYSVPSRVLASLLLYHKTLHSLVAGHRVQRGCEQ